MANKTLNYYVLPSSCDDHDVLNFYSSFLTTLTHTIAEYKSMLTVLDFYKR